MGAQGRLNCVFPAFAFRRKETVSAAMRMRGDYGTIIEWTNCQQTVVPTTSDQKDRQLIPSGFRRFLDVRAIKFVQKQVQGCLPCFGLEVRNWPEAAVRCPAAIRQQLGV